MPENEFEKKVFSEMQELRFRPSEKVWLQVEERIKTKKKRRIFVIIFLLAGIALLGYWQRNNIVGGNKNDIAAATEKKEDKNSKTSEETNNTSTVNPNSEAIKKEAAGIVNDKVDNSKIEIGKIKEDRSVVDNKVVGVFKKEASDPVKNKNENKAKPVTKKRKIDDASQASIVVVSADPQKKSSTQTELPGKPDIKTGNETNVNENEIKQPGIKPLENTTDSAKAQATQQEKNIGGKKDTVLKVEQPKQPAKPIVKQNGSEKKWKWGLHITPGISSLSDRGLAIGSQSSSDRLAYQNPTNSGSGMPPIRQEPSEPKPGFAFHAGGFVQKQLSSRTNISLGLQYGYYSNILHVGTKRDPFLNNGQFATVGRYSNSVYNAGADMTRYTNQYHFIELPLSFQWQLNKNNAKPFVWSAGFMVGQLLATNAIMYDTAFNGIYYQNKKLLNKTKFSLSTGFSWTIASNKKAQWSLGPVMNIHLNKLVDNPFDNKGYLFFAGLRTSVLFNQKK